MIYRELPSFETDEESDNWHDDKFCMDYNPWDNLYYFDMLLKPFGLTVVVWGDEPDAPFNIEKLEDQEKI